MISGNTESILTLAKDSSKKLPLTYRDEYTKLEVRAKTIDDSNIMEWLGDMYDFIGECEAAIR